jgi:DoxX-like family
MPPEIQAAPSKGMLWTGRILSALSSLLVGFAGIIKLTHSPQIIEGFAKMGYPASLVLPIGIIEVSCVIVYLIPRTSVLGAILLSGFLGGAIATCLRVGDPSLPLPVVTGIFVWGGLFFRDPRIRALIPLRSSANGD